MATEVLVVGAGYAGTGVISALQSNTNHLDITWVADSPNHLVKHEVHRVIRNPSVATDIQIPMTAIANDAVTIEQGTLTGIDESAREIVLESGARLSYDYLVLSVGARTAFYGVPGLAEHSICVESVSDAERIHEQVANWSNPEPMRIIVGGGGLTGVQTAGELTSYAQEYERTLDITLVEALDTILPQTDAGLQTRVGSALADRDVTVHTGSPIVSVSDDAVELDTDQSLSYDLLIWTGGITGRAIDANLEVERHRIAVDATLQSEDPRVFALGDAAAIPQSDGLAPPTAQAAWQAAPVAAGNVQAAIADAPLDRFEFSSKGTLVSLGEAALAHDIPAVPVTTFGGVPARFLKKLVAARWIASVTSWRQATSVWGSL